MKPECERCSAELAQETNEAYICSYECTFCAHCSENSLNFVCPNCGGNLVVRPARKKNPK
ncbi:MAG: DUF1272 domain-containing protein [Gammaproteobacteria bacterium]|nr:DUF1272 domain-containing protein [Gammaproteobacteria bacterium]